jgi:hypothetical protein
MTTTLDMQWVDFYAKALDDIETVRIANGNRLGYLTREGADADGEERGLALPSVAAALERGEKPHPAVATMENTVTALDEIEKFLIKSLERAMKDHPLGPWVKAQKGIGLKQAARLLASVGDPYWNDAEERPRLVSELWSYCGFAVRQDGTAPRRAKGAKANWSQDARKRAYLISCSIVKTTGPWRELYDAGRAQYAESVHPAECARCGPAKKPAQPGSPLSDGHKHARALRKVSKEVLRQLWTESRRLHGDTDELAA